MGKRKNAGRVLTVTVEDPSTGETVMYEDVSRVRVDLPDGVKMASRPGKSGITQDRFPVGKTAGAVPPGRGKKPKVDEEVEDNNTGKPTGDSL